MSRPSGRAEPPVTDVTAQPQPLVHSKVTDRYQVIAMSLPLRITAFLVLTAVTTAVFALPYLSIQ